MWIEMDIPTIYVLFEFSKYEKICFPIKPVKTIWYDTLVGFPVRLWWLPFWAFGM